MVSDLSCKNIPGDRAHTGMFLFAAGIALLLCTWGGWFGSPGIRPWLFIGLFVLTGLCGFSLILLLPSHWTPGRRVAAILVVSLVSRLLLLPHPVSDDMNRYIWEGRVLAAGFSPYRHAPLDQSLASLRDPEVWPGINHPDKAACYPPLILYAFSILGGAQPIKLFLILFDLLAVGSIILLLRDSGRDERWVLLYAMNPIVLYAFAGQGHLDAVHTGGLATALLFHRRRNPVLMFICIGIAIQAKYVAVLALPFLINRENLRYLWIGLAVLVVPFLPLLREDGLELFSSLFHFGSAMAFGGSIHPLLMVLLRGIGSTTIACGALYLLVYLWALFHFVPRLWGGGRDDFLRAICIVTAAFLLFSPTIHFWYIAWVLPLVALRPSPSWLVLSLSMALYFLAPGNQHSGAGWSLSWLAYLGMWGPFWFILLFEIYGGWRRLAHDEGWPEPKSFSVIVPTLNEASRIEDCIRSIQAASGDIEIIVVDAGSGDGTSQMADALGVDVIMHMNSPENGGGRGGQVNAGLLAAHGDVVVVVHADTCVEPDMFESIGLALKRNSQMIGGAVGSRFDGSGFLLRLLEFVNDTRAAFLAISFGDQVQFFRREPVLRLKLYPCIPLMEDVELSLRLQRLGQVAFLWGRCRVSPRRWEQSSINRAWKVVTLCAEYVSVRLWRMPDTIAMYRRYYG